MSDTPRTDAFVDEKNKRHMAAGYDDLEHYMRGVGEFADFARQLERELNAKLSDERIREIAERPCSIAVVATREDVIAVRMEAIREALEAECISR